VERNILGRSIVAFVGNIHLLVVAGRIGLVQVAVVHIVVEVDKLLVVEEFEVQAFLGSLVFLVLEAVPLGLGHPVFPLLHYCPLLKIAFLHLVFVVRRLERFPFLIGLENRLFLKMGRLLLVACWKFRCRIILVFSFL